MGLRAAARRLAVLAGVLGTSLLLCASVAAQGAETEGVAFGQVPNVEALGSTSVVSAYLAVGANQPSVNTGELISLSSLTPSVCTLSETHPARSPSAEVKAIALGVCTLSARSEAAEAQHSFTVVVGQAPKITWVVPTKAKVGGRGVVEVGSSSHTGAELSSTTAAVCKLTPVSNEKQPAGLTVAKVRFVAAGKCTIIAHVKGTGEFKSVEGQKSFRVHPGKSHRR